jgi:exosortase
MALQWDENPDYSHGWLVPLLGIAILWSRRSPSSDTLLATIGKCCVGVAAVVWAMGSIDRWEWLAAGAAAMFVIGASILIVEWAADAPLTPSLSGFLPLVFGGGLLLASTYYYLEWFERLAIVPLVFGVILLVCGRKVFWWSLPATAFLAFMIPLPYTLEVSLRDPLRTIGTSTSTYLMQMFGMAAYAEGHVIAIGEARIGVVEACSGLRMLTVFLALTGAVVLIIDRPWWHKCAMLLGALPIALIANIIRITITGICYVNGWEHLADLTLHDLAGWMMMPLGLVLLLTELWFLDRVIVTEVDRPLGAGLVPASPIP